MSSKISSDRISEIAYDIAVLETGNEFVNGDGTQVVTISRTNGSWTADCVEHEVGRMDWGTGYRDVYEVREESHIAVSLLKLIDTLDGQCWTVN